MKAGVFIKKLLKIINENKVLLILLAILISNQYITQILIDKSNETSRYESLKILSAVEFGLIVLILLRWTRVTKREVRVYSDASVLKQAEEKIIYLASYDPLTEMPNKVLFNDRGMQAISHAKRINGKVGVIFIDINRFKIINDTFGHNTGDLLLRAVSCRLKNCIREGDTISRISGDLFSILACNLTSENELMFIAQRILSKFNEPFNIEGHELFITLSLGMSIYPFNGQDIQDLMKNADTALNRAKENGNNTYEFYRTDMNDRALEKVILETDLRKALEKQEFYLVYQPQIDMKTGIVSGVEALLRWKHETLGTISPSSFIPLAEETGLIVPIGQWVMETACKQIKHWCDIGIDNLVMSVNVSAKQFEQPNIVDIVFNTLKKNNLPAKYLQLELTESLVMKNKNRLLEVICELGRTGVNVAIDDFGTGFSSLSYLKKLDVNQLKVDKSFVNEICIDYRDEAITEAIINMAHKLNLDVLVEGVETEEQFLILKKQNCDKIQGYYFSRPQMAEDFEKMLKQGQKLVK